MRKCIVLPSARIPSLGTPYLLRRAPGKLAADRAGQARRASSPLTALRSV
jgi:hypothetical protein